MVWIKVFQRLSNCFIKIESVFNFKKSNLKIFIAELNCNKYLCKMSSSNIWIEWKQCEFLFQLAVFLAVLWALNVLAFLYSKFLHIPPYACPLTLVVFLILYLINPFRILHYSSRMWLLKILVSRSIQYIKRWRVRERHLYNPRSQG